MRRPPTFTTRTRPVVGGGAVALQRHGAHPLTLCKCGQTMRRCDDCGAWVCSAPGHLAHRCEREEVHHAR